MEESSVSLFSSAVHELLDEMQFKSKDAEKNPFLKELISMKDQETSATSESGILRSDKSADRLRESIKELETQKTAERSYRILHRLSPFIENLKSLMQICEAVIQDAPFGVSIAFSGARVVLSLAFNVHSQFETILEAIEEIGTRLECYQLFAKYDSRPSFQKLLIGSYKNIIQFWFKASQALSQNFLKTMMKNITKPLHTVIKEAHDHLGKNSVLVQQYAIAIGLSNAKSDLEQRREDKSDISKKEIWESERRLKDDIAIWIRGHENLDANVDCEDQLGRRQEGTCNWIFEDQRFCEWRDSKHGSTLWYNAPPGSGKSVLASSVVNHLRKRNEKVVMFFYSFSNIARRNGINGIRSLALQILTMVQSVPDIVRQLYEEHRHYAPFLQSYSVARDLLQQLLSPLDHIYLIIDGVDECPDEGLMLPILRSLVQAKVYATVKWLLLSRDYSRIRKDMTELKAVELSPKPQVISADIQTYVTSNLACRHCFDEWLDGDEQNFLYARFVCETLRRVGLTRNADIEPALRRFPKTLNSYYIRSLEEYQKYSSEEQELVRRIFIILVAAGQSLSLRELVDASSIELGAKDYDSSRVPDADLIERLCGPIITLERRDNESQDNPTVRFYHKTVKDFLLQSPGTFDGMSMDASRYFVTPEGAHREMGQLCLTYLKYKRYSTHQDIKAVLEKGTVEHAFLPYAATFWFQHLWDLDPMTDVPGQVVEFLKSKAFWTCLSVQSHVARYLFGSFIGGRSGNYRMDFKAQKRDVSDHFGLPLPEWLSGLSADCMLMDQSLCCFAEEWREVIANHAQGLDLCCPLRNFAESCYLKPLSKAKKLRVEHLEDLSDMSAVAEARLLEVAFSGKRLSMEVLFRKKHDVEDVIHRSRATLLPNKDSVSSCYHLPLGGGLSGWDFVEGEDHTMEAWSIDPRTLNVRRTTPERSESFVVPPPTAKHVDSTGNGEWELVRVTTESGPYQNIPRRILHAGWRKKTVLPIPVQNNNQEDSDSDSGWDACDSDDENEKSDDSDSESMSGSSSSRDGNESSDTEHDAEDGEKETGNCLILVRPGQPPFWTRPWANSCARWEKVGCATHPTLPILVFTHTSLQLELVDLEKGVQESKHLPEPVDNLGKIAASTREVRFSPCGNYLHCLSISFVNEPRCTSCQLTVATYRFDPNGGSDETFIRGSQPILSRYSFSDRLAHMALPLTLTYWTDDSLLVALPPLTCDTKIILVNLPQGGDVTGGSSAIKTLNIPVYFPASTPRRDPRLLQRAGSDGKESYLYLALGALFPEKAPEAGNSADGNVGNQASPPVVLQWRMPQRDGWRAWDTELDGKSSDLKRDAPAWKALRGDFVESEKSYGVPIRCGLDWNRKGFLSCG